MTQWWKYSDSISACEIFSIYVLTRNVIINIDFFIFVRLSRCYSMTDSLWEYVSTIFMFNHVGDMSCHTFKEFFDRYLDGIRGGKNKRDLIPNKSDPRWLTRVDSSLMSFRQVLVVPQSPLTRPKVLRRVRW